MFGFGGKGTWPKVKTGPNKGQDRTRTKDGRIRGKRSDAGKSRKSS